MKYKTPSALLSLLLVLAVSCTSIPEQAAPQDSIPSPEPTTSALYVRQFIKGEATSLVIESLTETSCYDFVVNSFGEGEFGELYEGNGVWRVAFNGTESSTIWKVNEIDKSVRNTAEIFGLLGC